MEWSIGANELTDKRVSSHTRIWNKRQWSYIENLCEVSHKSQIMEKRVERIKRAFMSRKHDVKVQGRFSRDSKDRDGEQRLRCTYTEMTSFEKNLRKVNEGQLRVTFMSLYTHSCCTKAVASEWNTSVVIWHHHHSIFLTPRFMVHRRTRRMK
jgi:hypothetical protein